jgi:hypothetical protein
MLDFADGKTAPSDMADPKLGVVLVDRSASGDEHFKPRPSTLLCGDALKKELEDWRKSLGDKTYGLRATYSEERLSCVDGAEPYCRRRGAAEYDPSVDFLFRRDARGALKLRAIVLVDELLVAEAAVKKTRTEALETVRKLEIPGCPP